MTRKQRDLDQLFGFLLDEGLSLPALIERYVNYHGALDFGHEILLIQRLRAAASILDEQAVVAFNDRDIVEQGGRIGRGFLVRFAPGFAGAYYDPAPDDDFERTLILPASPNEWCSADLPAPFNIRLQRAERPAVEMLFGPGRQLFVSPFGYQLTDPSGGRSWRLAASRAFPRSIEGCRHVAVESPVAVIQDGFDGGDLTHFLYDSVPRVLYLAELFPEFARQCRFLLGGEPGSFHVLIIRRICEKYGLASTQFVFPRDPEIWTLRGPATFFSDQVETHTHPLHMAHGRTLKLVRGLLDGGTVPADTPERIYISCEDAPNRRIVNNAALAAVLADEGYASIRMSALDPAAQIGLLARARHVVAPHGMGLTGLVFNQTGGSVLEIFNPRIGTDAYAFVARALGMNYRFSVGHDQDDGRLGTKADVDAVLSLVRSLAPRPGASVAHHDCGGDRPRLDATTAKTLSHSDPSKEAVPAHAPSHPMLTDTELGLQFESLGDNCEFGLVQRFVGAEPLGFLRFNYTAFSALTEMLDTDFTEVDRPEDIALVRANEAGDSELLVHNRRYGYSYHTFRHDTDAGPVRAQQLRVVSFLRDKLVGDLRSAEKIFVRKGVPSADDAASLLRRLRRYGPVTLLWVLPEDELCTSGTVRVLQPGLLQGFIDRLAPPVDAYDLSPAWITVCRNALALRAGGCQPGTVITPPRNRLATNLLRQVHLGPRKAGRWVSAESTESLADTDGPTRVHPASPVLMHTLVADTVHETSAIAGVAIDHELAPGASYVAAMDVWIPEEAAVERVGIVFNGLPATQFRMAEPKQRNCWQRVWVIARAPHPNARVNPSLTVIGRAGARLYSTAWQMEIGQTPGPYVASTTGILPSRGPSPESFRPRATLSPEPSRATTSGPSATQPDGGQPLLAVRPD